MHIRSTGKTFRLLLNCLFYASQGDWVIYISPYPLEYAIRMARDITHCLQDISYFDNEIVFPNGGRLEFQTDEIYIYNKYRGLKPQPMIQIDQ